MKLNYVTNHNRFTQHAKPLKPSTHSSVAADIAPLSSYQSPSSCSHLSLHDMSFSHVRRSFILSLTAFYFMLLFRYSITCLILRSLYIHQLYAHYYCFNITLNLSDSHSTLTLLFFFTSFTLLSHNTVHFHTQRGLLRTLALHKVSEYNNRTHRE